jgi:hypothetical protein
MYPPEIRSETQSGAEKKLFGRMQRELGDDWVVLHSVGLTEHRTKPWAEIDFVLVGPPGVFCLEIKGGRVARRDGQWLFTNTNDVTTAKYKGPFEQVGPAAAALKNHLRDKHPGLRYLNVDYGVCTPDITWNITGPDILPETIYDDRDWPRSFGAYMRRLADYWHERHEKAYGHPVNSLSEAERALIVDELRGDFDLRPSLKTRIGRAEEELIELTKQQYHVLDNLRDNARVIIRGGAGTGKTLLAVEEARRRAAKGEKVFLCCRNPLLGSVLRAAVKDFGTDAVNVRAGDLGTFMAATIADAGLQHKLPDAEPDDLFDVFYPEYCAEALLSPERFQTYDALIVDEAQDLLLPKHLDVFDGLLKGGLKDGEWKIFYDPFQDIFRKMAVGGIQRLNAYKPAKFTLDVNCRNTEQIAIATQILSTIFTSEATPTHGPDVEHLWVRDKSHAAREISKYIGRLLSEGIHPEEIVVLSPQNRRYSCLADGLVNIPCPLNECDGIVPPTGTIRFAHIGAYKGLESKAVVICDIANMEDEDALTAIYVGASRAKTMLAVALDQTLQPQFQVNSIEHGRRYKDWMESRKATI